MTSGVTNYEHQRAHLSHVLMRSGILNRLSLPPDLWSDPTLASEIKIGHLIDGWCGLGDKPDTVKFVRRVWRGDAGLGVGVLEAARLLFEAAIIDVSWKPTARFPTRTIIKGWLEDMDAVMSIFGSSAQQVAALPREDVRIFWTSGLSLFRLLQDTQRGTTQFYEYFERIR